MSGHTLLLIAALSLPWFPVGFGASWLSYRFSWRGRGDRRLMLLAERRFAEQTPLVYFVRADGELCARPANREWLRS